MRNSYEEALATVQCYCELLGGEFKFRCYSYFLGSRLKEL